MTRSHSSHAPKSRARPPQTGDPIPDAGPLGGAHWPALARATTRRALWSAILTLVRERFTFTSAILGFPYEDGIPVEMSGTALPRQDADGFRRRLTNPNPAAAFTDAHPEVRVAEISEALTPAIWEDSPLYRNVFQPQGWYYALGLFFRRKGRFFALAAFTRGPEDRNFSAAEKQAAEALHPHFAAAIERVWEVECQTNTVGVLARRLRGLPQALALLNGEGQVLWATRAAHEQAARWVAQPGGELLALPGAAITALHTLQAACGDGCAHPGATMPPPILCQHAEWLELRLQISAEPPAVEAGAPLFLVHFLEAAFEPPATSTSRWMALLTAGERRVAEAVSEGLANREIATKLKLSVHTVSAHLRKIYAKLDVHSRHGLVTRLTSEPARHSDRSPALTSVN